MDKTLGLGAVEVTVADLDRSVDYYSRAIGMRLLHRGGAHARLGVPGRALVELREEPGATAPPPSSPGLSHFAPQVPTRADLARFARHYAELGREMRPIDHTVARSCYVTDPDGHVVEMTCASPRAEWRWVDGRPAVVADVIELADLLGEPGADLPYGGLPAGTEMGHVQLKVTDPGLAATEPFYCDLLGLEVAGRLGTAFLAAGVADDQALLVFTNRFSPQGGDPAPPGTARLLGIDLRLPGPAEIEALAERLATAGHPHRLAAGVLLVRDPSGNLLRFGARPA
jgi:catechol 2,3-dioxygenase